MIITILLGITTLIFASLYFLLQGSIKNAKNQMDYIINNPGTNRQIHTASPDKVLEELTIEINKLIAARQQDRILYEEQKQEIRRQVANVTHDLRTPLTSILGYLALAKEKDAKEEDILTYLDISQNRAKALQSLISGFYELARIEAKDFPVSLQSLDVGFLLKRALADHYKDFSKAGFEVKLQIFDNLPSIIADEHCIIRVFTNLLQNVRKHGNTSMNVFHGQKENNFVTVISNQTSSLSPDDINHVFERSFTSDKSRTSQNTGLGLPVVKSLIELMGYDVEAKYEQGVFSITLHWTKQRRQNFSTSDL